jgi:aminoglycoside 6'-N-acetyltransferase I
MDFRIVDLTTETPHWIEQVARVLHEVFRHRTEEWQDLESARTEVIQSLASARLSRVAVNPSNTVLGWVGGIPTYGGRVWEVHPLVVAPHCRRRGVGRALLEDLERAAAARGALTLWLGSDDENDETSLSGVDLYADIAGAIRDFHKRRGEHPCDFYLRLGFRITGLMPDANGQGKPDIYFAKPIGSRRPL